MDYGVVYRSLWINLYRDNRDSTGWRGDLIGRVRERSIVPVLSLGAAATLSHPAGRRRQECLPAAWGRRADRRGWPQPARLATLCP
jgi:hypothetical protein